MEGIKVVICEDEVLIAEHLRTIVSSFGCDVVGVAYGFNESLELIENSNPDLALLDIRMDGPYDGIQIGQFIRQNYNFPFIYITAFSDKALVDKALEVNPYGYIVKPFEKMEIYSAIKIALDKQSVLKQERYTIIKDGYKEIKLYHDHIRYIKCDNIYIEIYTPTNKYVVRNSLENFLSELDDISFRKCHRSFCVNMKFVKQLNSNSLVVDDCQIPVSRKYGSMLKKIFNAKL